MKKRKLAPKLVSKQRRVRSWTQWPREVKEGVRAIARHHGWSMSWTLEQVVTDWVVLRLGIRRPQFVRPKQIKLVYSRKRRRA